ncbi:EamA family transporter [uncultured Thermanaerothrix sp.]|uniref:EamA family transporter n=1 Tax=uncultured Thermanaerothrix sp. TaxID=1195149 RepID=UPI002602810C|nr:EamA family transporter [uncultured Thermanaerothrix sp.]
MALLSAILGALVNWLARDLLRRSQLREIFGLNFALIFGMMLPLAPFYFRLVWQPEALGWLVLSIGLDAMANYAYFQAFVGLDAVTATTLLALSPLFTLLIALGVPGQSAGLQSWQVVGVVVCTGSVLALTRAQPQVNGALRRGTRPMKAWLYPLAAAALFGASLYPVRLLFTQGWTNPPTYYLVRAGIIALVTGRLAPPAPFEWGSERVRRLALRAALVIGQWLALLFALEGGAPAVVKALADTSPLFVVGVSAIMGGEKPTRAQVVAAGGVVAGVALLLLGAG